jgi:16S rRNA (uracil1498-N3)-methyltransferase
MQRFFVEPSSIRNNSVELSREQAHQVRDVLRLKVGDDIIVLDNAGWEYSVRLSAIERNKAIGDVIEKRPATGEPGVHITLYQSMPAREKFELVLQKCTEIGVFEFVPVITQRSIVRGSSGTNRIARWRRIITEAAEQCERGRIPELREPVIFERAIKENQISNIKYQNCGSSCLQTQDAKLDCRLIASTSAARHLPAESGAKNLREALTAGGKAPTSIALFIGPEGGFTDEEVQVACENGIVPVSLGKRILRTETAGVVASALVLYELGEMGP